MATKAEIGTVLSLLASAYPTFELRKETSSTYADLLGDLPGDLLFVAAKQHIAQCRYFPAVSELRGIAQDLLELSNGAPAAVEAWAWVLHWIPDSGRGRRGGHPLIEQAVEAIGGWEYLGQQKMSDRHWTQNRFQGAYRELLDAHRQEQALVPEARRIAFGNDGERRLGRGEEPSLIGDGEGEPLEESEE